MKANAAFFQINNKIIVEIMFARACSNPSAYKDSWKTNVVTRNATITTTYFENENALLE